MARVTGLEPATSGVTGRRSNQLSYTRSDVRGPRLYGRALALSSAVERRGQTAAEPPRTRCMIRPTTNSTRKT